MICGAVGSGALLSRSSQPRLPVRPFPLSFKEEPAIYETNHLFIQSREGQNYRAASDPFQAQNQMKGNKKLKVKLNADVQK